MIRERKRQYSRLEIALEAAQIASRLPRPFQAARSATEYTAERIAYAARVERTVHKRVLKHLADNFPDDSCHIDGSAPGDWRTAQRRWLVAVETCEWPTFAVEITISVVQSAQAILGVVVNPLNNQIFVAERGRGAYQHLANKQVQQLHVSHLNRFEHAWIGIGWGQRPSTQQHSYSVLRMTFPKVHALIVNLGALGLAQVAGGRLEAYLHHARRPWALLAGALLVEEAGGQLTTRTGRRWTPARPDLLAGSALLADIHRRLAHVPLPDV